MILHAKLLDFHLGSKEALYTLFTPLTYIQGSVLSGNEDEVAQWY